MFLKIFLVLTNSLVTFVLGVIKCLSGNSVYFLCNICWGRGHTAPRGQSFDVNRNFLPFRSVVASFKSQTTIVSEISIVLPFSYTKA